MERRRWAVILICLALVGLMMTTASCSKKKVIGDDTVGKDQLQKTGGGAGTSDADREAREKALEEARRAQEEGAAGGTGAAGGAYGASGYGDVIDEDVYFSFDSAVLSGEAQENLRRKAEWLKSHADKTVTIEGHCDERGTNEYNMALGDRRAESAKSFLSTLGIAASRMNTISYGEERPADSGSGESAWSKNRRAHFVVQ